MALIPFDQRADIARKRLPELKRIMANCRLCPRECEKLRFRGESGECGLEAELIVSSAHLHHGEEPVLSGIHGSGTVFFTGCNLACLFCQNYPISQFHSGTPETAAKAAKHFLELQEQKAHNINLVTPTPQAMGILEALIIAWDKGLKVPVVYNCGGYESLEVLEILDGLIDIYLADMKYGKDELGVTSGVNDYFSKASIALKEMQRQTGDLITDNYGIAVSGLIVRHLVLPEDRSASKEVLKFLAGEISNNVYISLMSQYYPSHKATSIEGLNRKVKRGEYAEVVELMNELGLKNGWIQPVPY
ncbi:MAG: hypothetical protein P9L92_20545 [Candidatus Electryonea clarkiae]|nr:hypothetical protein [Candidatus Electryonea clarkiae]MDP8285087.1 hypothetical protein [Candidatus Electryonea clarkiae]